MIIDVTLTQCYTFSNCNLYQPIYYLHRTRMLKCVKALHSHFRDDFNVSIIHQFGEFGWFWVKIGSFIKNMTSSGLFTKTLRLLNRNILLNTLSNMGYKTHLLAISGETIL